MGLSKINLLNYILITLILSVVLAANVSAETTFFDQDDAFIMSNYARSNYTTGATGVTTGGESCMYEWKCASWSTCINGKQTRKCVDIGTCDSGTFTETRDCIVKSALAATKGAPAITGGAVSPQKEQPVPLSMLWFGLIAALLITGIISWAVLKKRNRKFYP